MWVVSKIQRCVLLLMRYSCQLGLKFTAAGLLSKLGFADYMIGGIPLNR